MKSIIQTTLIGGGIFAAVIVALFVALIRFGPNACESLIVECKQSDLSTRLEAWANEHVFGAQLSPVDLNKQRGSNVGAKWAFVKPPFSWATLGADLAAGETAMFIVPSSYDGAQKSQFDDFATIEFKVAGRRSILVKKPDAASFGFTPSNIDTMELLSPNVAVICRRRD